MATARIRSRRTDVRDAALALFAERGYHGTSMKDIAAAVGMRAPSLYNHVGAKQDLLVEIIEATLADLQRDHEAAVGSTRDVAQALRRAVEAHVRYHARHPREVRVGNRDLSALEPAGRERVIGMRRRYARSWQALLQRGADEGRFDLPDARLASYAILEMGIGVATWFRPDGPLSEDVVAYHYGDMALRLAGAAPPLSPAGRRGRVGGMSADEPFRLTGRVAVVTGSSSGLGEAIAHELAAAGAAVVVSSRELARAQAVAGAIAEAGGRAVAVAGDVTQPAAVEELAARARDDLGGLDVWVNNAGIGMVRPSLELSLEDWQRTLDLDLTATFVGCQVAGSHMVAAGRGVIVNVSSVAGHTALPLRAAYCAAKHGVVGLTKVLSAEWAPHGVRVVSVDPAFVMTPLVRQSMADGRFAEDDILRRTPLGRLGQAPEVARAVRFLVSDAASYVTGAQLMVDGGWTANGGW